MRGRQRNVDLRSCPTKQRGNRVTKVFTVAGSDAALLGISYGGQETSAEPAELHRNPA